MARYSSRVFLVAILSSFLISIASRASFADGLYVFSEGYRVGLLTTFGLRTTLGMARRHLGAQMMGINSTPYSDVEEYDCGTEERPETCTRRTVINPWNFIVEESLPNVVSQLEELIGQYVILKYSQVRYGNMFYENDYRVEEVYLPNQTIPAQTCSTDQASGIRGRTSQIGRVVKLSEKGDLIKTLEMKFQVGTGGNQFIDISVPDQSMRPCILNSLYSMRLVTISYYEKVMRNPLTEKTPLELSRLSPAQQVP